MTPVEPLWTVEETAAHLKVSKSWLYAAVDRGDIPSAKLGHLLRFRRADIEEWLRAKFAASTARAGRDEVEVVR